VSAPVVEPAPDVEIMRFARAEERLAWIDLDGRHVGAVVFGTPSRPFKVNFDGYGRGRFRTWAEVLACVEGLSL
jgi:hypothetical protein